MKKPGSVLYDSNFQASLRDGALRSARAIVPILLTHIQPRSVADLGCGVGAWLKAFQEAGITDIMGYDGDYVDLATLLIDRAQFQAANLRESAALDRRFDLMTSLEVAEHLPASDAKSFIRRLTSATHAVLFSAAIPGQGGTDHVNEQWQDYWRHIFGDEGFEPVDLIRPAVRGRHDVELWYQQNMLLYCDQDYLAVHPHLCPVDQDLSLNVVHPSLYERARVADARKVVKMVLHMLSYPVNRNEFCSH